MMRKIFAYTLSLFIYISLNGQVVTVDDFMAMSSLSGKKASNYISKKGFVQTAQNYDDGKITHVFSYNSFKKKGKEKEPPDSVTRFISGYEKGKNSGVIYQTSSLEEYDLILKEFADNGYISGKEGKDSLLFFQKGDVTVHMQEVKLEDEDGLFYEIRFERKPVPTLSSVKFADDLLEFDSHESLVMLFGKENVKKDVYYFSEKEVTRCSVLYPNTKWQAIFIWADQENSRKLSYVLIGSSLRTESSSDFNRTIALNSWQSHSGLHTGMKLEEIVRYNEADFQFFGLNSEFAFMAVPEKKGNIDFKKTGIVLGCMNGTGNPVLRSEKVSAEDAINAGLQLYILSIVLLPEDDSN